METALTTKKFSHTVPFLSVNNLRETIETGGAVIRLLLFDPLLPDALLAGNRRQTLIQRLADYDQAGQRIWQDFVDQLSEEAS